jgi:hypothetical protein
VRYEDRGLWRRGGRTRHLTVLGEIGAGEVNYGEESIWKTGRLSMYFLCGNANKIYLDALHDVIPSSLPPIAENDCQCKMTVEYDCPESLRASGHITLILFTETKRALFAI